MQINKKLVLCLPILALIPIKSTSPLFSPKVKRQFDELTESESLKLLKLWADALEKDGNIELAIIKAQEANDRVLFNILLYL